ncbi:fatty acid elongase [Leishmania donovani]|uniref:Elongation of fatty acids protein n=3 Tax=Leishmania donovani species complex TaxID=38574 RepID=A0A6L0WWN6_LEIIN|nr:beta-ketoacyl-CoA synthase [Leishmania infantum JPCM5]TPP53477.1 GNS1/SUR4 family protein [Leishmania donovani]CAC9468957.1 fatty_acid_elongase_-_putative [Leishmania infantum]CAJ1987341.1 fatty acid elongase [Leishmania donovani]CAM66633.1 beta-ketoacyl-CoA synthase [Leishmania infantum JPCM5]SUZ40303.1 fatty_acid_elongase_-_putative [Leishmania infantum]|eukprot:XP_001464254.1 beta-ketoacyl-CoA synthase [Leishmania infantum JPCM5]
MESAAPSSTVTATSLTASSPSLSNPFLWAHHYITSFKGGKPHQWMCASPHIPLLIVVGYFLLVHAGPRVFSRLLGGKPVPGLAPIVAIWNLFFSIASTIGFCYCAPFLFRVLTMTNRELPGLAPKKDRTTGEWDQHPHVRGGLFTSLCYWNRNIFEDGATAFWVLTFNLSKIVELMDTVFLLLRHKPVPFIHWYHHASVMLFCWHAHVSGISNGLGFAVMNMLVHSIMYFYYFMCACGQRKLVRPFASMVTLLQIAQMFAGMALILYTTRLYVTHPGGCDTSASSLAFGTVMYLSYIILFVKLFRDNYVLKKRDGRERRRDTKVGY